MTFAELHRLYHLPFFELLDKARAVHREYWPKTEVQLCTLLSIKTGGCSEDCSYCAQSARYNTGVKAEKLMSTAEVMPIARRAAETGSTRFCMGAAWKGVRDNDPRFESVLETIREVSKLGMEVCVTLGQLSPDAARRLKEAGVTAYNHNIDTSPEFYPEIVSTHTFKDRLETIGNVQNAGMALCCGGILGLGEGEDDRLRMLQVLSCFDPQPESVPINALMAMPGTPLEENTSVDSFELARMIATARIALPKSKIRLSAGRTNLSQEAQTLCFYAGANSIFYGSKLLTAQNPGRDADMALLEKLGLQAQQPYADQEMPSSLCGQGAECDVDVVARQGLAPMESCHGGGCGCEVSAEHAHVHATAGL
ncbi:MAG: biotin synthase BioB [Candidatus Methylacidiphilales bacterium]|nr:biotin synthase BioB [Candidatus Methylacidiphilales bacterium]